MPNLDRKNAQLWPLMNHVKLCDTPRKAPESWFDGCSYDGMILLYTENMPLLRLTRAAIENETVESRSTSIAFRCLKQEMREGESKHSQSDLEIDGNLQGELDEARGAGTECRPSPASNLLVDLDLS